MENAHYPDSFIRFTRSLPRDLHLLRLLLNQYEELEKQLLYLLNNPCPIVCLHYLELQPELLAHKHLQKYIDEFVFRYNTRKLNESDRFNFMLSNLSSHITYKQLTDNGKKEITWFNPAPINRQAQYQQGSFGF